MPTTDSRRSGPAALVDRYPAGSYFALTLALSWGYWLPVLSLDTGFPTVLVLVPGAFGPALAAVLVTKLRGESVRAWVDEAVLVRGTGRWYAVAVGLPVAVSAAMAVALVAVTGRFDASVVPAALATFAFNLVLATLLGGGQEELGWRAFALPHLQARFDALTASVLIGLVWALWHAPLFVFDVSGYGNLSPPLYAASVVGFAVVFTWFHNGSRACLPAAMLLHGAINASVNVPPVLVGGPDTLPVPFAGILAVAFWTVALALLARHGRETLSSDDPVLPTWTEREREGDDGPAAVGTPEVSD